MRLTTIEHLKSIKVNDVLYLINPFEYSDQSRVNIEILTIQGVLIDRFLGCIKPLNPDVTYQDSHHFDDLIFKSKYVLTTLEEAEECLKRVKSGLHEEEVINYHKYCEEWLSSYPEEEVY